MKRAYTTLNPAVKDDAWVKSLRRYRALWQLFAVFLFVGVAIIEVASGFTANFMYLFAVIAVVLINFILADMIDGRIEEYESEKIWSESGKKNLHYLTPDDGVDGTKVEGN